MVDVRVRDRARRNGTRDLREQDRDRLLVPPAVGAKRAAESSEIVVRRTLAEDRGRVAEDDQVADPVGTQRKRLGGVLAEEGT